MSILATSQRTNIQRLSRYDQQPPPPTDPFWQTIGWSDSFLPHQLTFPASAGDITAAVAMVLLLVQRRRWAIRYYSSWQQEQRRASAFYLCRHGGTRRRSLTKVTERFCSAIINRRFIHTQAVSKKWVCLLDEKWGVKKFGKSLHCYWWIDPTKITKCVERLKQQSEKW